MNILIYLQFMRKNPREYKRLLSPDFSGQKTQWAFEQVMDGAILLGIKCWGSLEGLIKQLEKTFNSKAI